MAFLRIQIENNQYKDYDLKEGRTSIGRSPDSDIVIENPSVSNEHARLNFDQHHFFLTDLRSSNGTFLNGKKILHVKLADGDMINFASVPVTFFK
ncbi:MAG: FHA domain-containing protein [gamma proteobacterium symbiont of Bathyaustriella thionipta]|nr:FHA domain-containing protein [gamma proteobacterium symbiont of Bathyaustriella thionipta]MCU7949400.1 FHA domain-containing protein [gamma proteobacterium symbiont of Bathyaustriella thionipta]MCU7953605.1 FHA domain-containing protein [gamma proteobacterium symbiont of Bathyaustriella thionipta]MCU7956254.1 FHA domain-containing protein [gamma proteobacterium symbiont of Bathyaustriella thionipta]MCU7965990.1 FHA domain-containing protein [gamma proteobacterium symbiont of Bathyaustriella